jgi:hypothetical protein
MGRLSREKGKRGEREVVNVFKANGVDARRTAPMQADGKGDDSDVALSVPGFHIESKMAARITIVEWTRQAAQESGPTRVPVVAWRLCSRGNSTPWQASLPLEDFAVLVARSAL